MWSPWDVSITRPAAAPARLDDLLARLPDSEDLAVVADEGEIVIGLGAREVVSARGDDCFGVLDRLSPGWWAAALAYDLGRAVERVPNLTPELPEIPDLLVARFATRIRLAADGTVTTEGDPCTLGRSRALKPPRLGPWTSSLGPGEWARAVATIHEHLLRGDCYQVNLTRRLESPVAPDPVALFRALVAGNPAPHAALVRIGSISVISASPERFLRRAGRHVQTRPIKGTAASADVLRASAKDRAENVMIVDLARNDLGRVCAYGSVRVPSLCAVEAHPGLYHLVSTVEGELRPDVTDGELLRATFPPASVTGCPKPRVLEIIETLEPVRRGIYCGAVGFVDTDRDVLDLNVAIRTFTVTGGTTSFGVGGGIVADSDARAEWEETELKARRLLAIAQGDA